MLNEFRTECVLPLSQSICTESGGAVHDTLLFFHGNGPAQQFQAGQSRGETTHVFPVKHTATDLMISATAIAVQ